MSRIRQIGTAVAVFLIGAIASASVATYVSERVAYEPPDDPAAQYTHAAYDSATTELYGTLHAPLTKRLRTESHDGRTVTIALRAGDIPTCEDLGRQIRSLRAALEPTDRFEIWTASVDTSAVRTFLEVERIGSVAVRAVDLRSILEGRDHLPTPAALVLGPNGNLIEGVAHPTRFRNLRPRSFAEELTVLRAPSMPRTSR